MLLHILVLCSVALAEPPQRKDLVVRLQQPADGPAVVEVQGLSDTEIAALARQQWQPAQWASLFSVHVAATDAKSPPPLLGAYRVEKGRLVFQPRFPLAPGVTYRGEFNPACLPGGGGRVVRADFTLPQQAPAARTVVERVFPTRSRLPENQLKFYIHFSAPMSRGDVYRHLKLLKENGKEVELPFLELDEELWDPDGRRFTLLFDPGRIKRGLKPREEAGPILEEGKKYTLVVDRDWLDAAGRPLGRPFRKSIQVGPPDDQPIDPTRWKLTTPAAGSRSPLSVALGEPLDHALVSRLVWVEDGQGRRLPGAVQVLEEETRWQFQPRQPWAAGRHRLVVDTSLEDLAGNRVGEPFEVDVFRRIERQVKSATVAVPFEVR